MISIGTTGSAQAPMHTSADANREAPATDTAHEATTAPTSLVTILPASGLHASTPRDSSTGNATGRRVYEGSSTGGVIQGKMGGGDGGGVSGLLHGLASHFGA